MKDTKISTAYANFNYKTDAPRKAQKASVTPRVKKGEGDLRCGGKK